MTMNEAIIKDFERRMSELYTIEDPIERRRKADELMLAVFMFSLGEDSGEKLFKEYKELTA